MNLSEKRGPNEGQGVSILFDSLLNKVGWLSEPEYSGDVSMMRRLLSEGQGVVVPRGSITMDNSRKNIVYPRDTEDALIGRNDGKMPYLQWLRRGFRNNYRYHPRQGIEVLGAEDQAYSLEISNSWVGDKNADPDGVLSEFRRVKGALAEIRRDMDRSFTNVDRRNRAVQNIQASEAYLEELVVESIALNLKNVDASRGRKLTMSYTLGIVLNLRLSGLCEVHVDYYNRVNLFQRGTHMDSSFPGDMVMEEISSKLPSK